MSGPHVPAAREIADLSAGAGPSSLKEAEALQLVVDALPALISYIDAGERYRLVNRAYERWFGEERGAVLGRTVREVLGDAAYAAVQPHVVGVLAGEPQTFESRLTYPSGARYVRIEYIPHFAPGGDVRGFFALVIDVGDQKRAEETQRFLAEATALLDPVLDLVATFQRIAELAVASIADVCAFHRLDPDGAARLWVLAHRDPTKAALATALMERYGVPPDLERLLHSVLAGARGGLLPEVESRALLSLARDAEHLAALSSVAGYRSAVTVPIQCDGQVLAALTLASVGEGRAYDAGDLALAHELARRVGLAVQRARLYEKAREAEAEARRLFLAEQEARRAAERAMQRMSALQRTTAALADALTTAAVAAVVLDHGVTAAGARGGMLLGGPEAAEGVEAIGCSPEIVERFGEMCLRDPSPATDALRTGAPVWVRSPAEHAALYPHAPGGAVSAPAGTSSAPGGAAAPGSAAAFCCLPLIAGDRRFGVLTLIFGAPCPFEREDQDFLVALSHQCAQAFERARLHEERAALIQRERRVALENARLYREAHEADRRKDEFIAMLSHELRNPLSPITTGLELLRMNAVDREDAPILATIERQVKTIVRLVDDLLDVSRITRGKIALRRERLDLAAALASAVASVRELAAQRQHQLLVEVEPALYVHGDRVRIEQIAVNLLTNAIKYTNPGGRIELTCEARGGEARLQVTDTGVGISAELLPHVFEPFMQARRALDRSQGGLGIGLTLVKQLTELHGGRVEVRSGGLGAGATFNVWLPLARSPAQGAAPRPSEPLRLAASELRILVVDDNVDAAEGLRRVLEAFGHVVTMAHDGPSAIEAARAARPALILLDIGLPGMDGYEVVRRLRDDPDLGRPCIVAVSGYGQDQDRRRSREAGFDAHLTKPVATDQLIQFLVKAAGQIEGRL